MKKILPILSVVILSGCANIKFDGHQYDTFITLKEQATEAATSCDRPVVVKAAINSMQKTLNHEYLYASNRTYSTQLSSSIQSLSDIVNGLATRYTQAQVPSTVYCQEKMQFISNGAAIIYSTMGKL